MKNKTSTLIVCITMLFIFVFIAKTHLDRYEPYPTELINVIQYSDLAGLGTLMSFGETNDTLEVEVKQWWLGSWPTNRLEIGNLDYEMWDANKFYSVPCFYDWVNPSSIGRDIVFFAMTNEYKWNSSPRPNPFSFDWNFTQTFTNAGPISTPVFYYLLGTPLFLVDTNSNFYVNALSNITESIFISRDKMQFYRGLRDAWGIEGNKIKPLNLYQCMARFPFMLLLGHNDFTESERVEMLNDPLLFPPYRTNALNRLIRDFNWSPTNTVPFP